MKNAEQLGKVLYVIVALIIFVSIGFTFYKTYILKDYQIEAQVSCDPKTEQCFVSTCDPSTDDTCSQNPDEQTTYYKKISKKAANIYTCENTPDKAGCGDELSCTVGELNCSYTYCDPSQLSEGEECSTTPI